MLGAHGCRCNGRRVRCDGAMPWCDGRCNDRIRYGAMVRCHGAMTGAMIVLGSAGGVVNG